MMREHDDHDARRRDVRCPHAWKCIMGWVSWTVALAVVGLLANGCGVDCEAACEEAVERCGGTIGYEYITRGLCADYCDRGGSWGECFDCMNEERSCDGLRCLRDESCRDRHGVFKGGEG